MNWDEQLTLKEGKLNFLKQNNAFLNKGEIIGLSIDLNLGVD